MLLFIIEERLEKDIFYLILMKIIKKGFFKDKEGVGSTEIEALKLIIIILSIKILPRSKKHKILKERRKQS